MLYLICLKKEALAETEFKILSRGSQAKKLEENVFLLETNHIKPYIRMAYAKKITRVIGKLGEIKSINTPGPVAIRVLDKESNKKEVYKSLIPKLKHKKIDLEHPKSVLNVFKDYVGFNLEPEKFTKKLDPKSLPYHPSITMKPKTARFMANMSKPKGSILDPLVGTGVLLASFPKECRLYGSDLNVEGAKTNLRFLGKKAKIRKIDIRELEKWGMKFDRIITDLPYGTSTPLFGVKQKDFYAMALKSMPKVLKKEGRIVIAFPAKHENIIKRALKNQDLTVLYKIRQRVHKSLTRCFMSLSIS